MKPENFSVMSEFLPDGVDPGRLDEVFPDLDFEPEKRKFLRSANQAAAYALTPVFLTMAGGAVDEESILEESRRFLEIGQILAPIAGFLYGYGEHRSWRKNATGGKPDSFRCIVEGAELGLVFWLIPNLALSFLNAPNDPSDLWRIVHAAKTVLLPISYGLARSPKV